MYTNPSVTDAFSIDLVNPVKKLNEMTTTLTRATETGRHNEMCMKAKDSSQGSKQLLPRTRKKKEQKTNLHQNPGLPLADDIGRYVEKELHPTRSERALTKQI